MIKTILFYILMITISLSCTKQLKVKEDKVIENPSLVKGLITIQGNDLFTDGAVFQILNESKNTITVTSDLIFGDQNVINLTYPGGRVHTFSNRIIVPNEVLPPGEFKNYPFPYVYWAIINNSLKENGKLKILDGTYKLRWINKKYDIDIEEEIYFDVAEFRRRGY